MITSTYQKSTNHPKQATEKQSHLPSSLSHLTSSILHLTSYIIHLPSSFLRAPARKYNNVCSFSRASVGASFFAPKYTSIQSIHIPAYSHPFWHEITLKTLNFPPKYLHNPQKSSNFAGEFIIRLKT